MKCKLLDIEMPLGKKCPSSYNLDGFKCYKGCGFSGYRVKGDKK